MAAEACKSELICSRDLLKRFFRCCSFSQQVFWFSHVHVRGSTEYLCAHQNEWDYKENTLLCFFQPFLFYFEGTDHTSCLFVFFLQSHASLIDFLSVQCRVAFQIMHYLHFTSVQCTYCVVHCSPFSAILFLEEVKMFFFKLPLLLLLLQLF